MNGAPQTTTPPRTRARWFTPFVDRKPRWAPTWRGWLLAAVFVFGSAAVVLRGIHPFLALDAPLPEADVLVIEGWIPEYALAPCAAAIKSGRYQHILTVGGPVTGAPSPAAYDDTHAYVALRNLRKLGVSADKITLVPTPRRERDRTFHSALDVQSWLAREHIKARGVNVVTLGAHCRRSRLLFQRALGEATPVGVICIPNEEYDAGRWWRYSEGIRELISESAAYLYARCGFVS